MVLTLSDLPRPGPVVRRASEGSAFHHKELFAVDAELNRTAKGVIDRILHLRDSL